MAQNGELQATFERRVRRCRGRSRSKPSTCASGVPHAHLARGSFTSSSAIRGSVVVDCRHALARFRSGTPALRRVASSRRLLRGGRRRPRRNEDRQERASPAARIRSASRDFCAAAAPTTTSQIVAYDAGGDMFAARLWFLSRWIGHDAVAVLDGGFAAWTRARLSGHSGASQAAARHARGSTASRVYRRRRLRARASRQPMRCSCSTRARASATPANRRPIDPVAGHIPGARNRFFKDNFDASGRFKSPDALREEFEAAGLDPQRIVHQCGSGVSAAAQLLRDAPRRPRRLARLQRFVERMDRRSVAPHRTRLKPE